MKVKKYLKVIVSGGGTGGHIFPAISIANALRTVNPEVEILFVGALGRMEMEKVPAAGYEIKGLPVAGFQRKFSLHNINVIFKLFKSMKLARSIIKSFEPDVVVGVGGYASGPVLKIAQRKGIPTLIQEQNSFAGVTNRLLAKKADAICVAYEGMEKYFPKEKILLTGNPVRQGLEDVSNLKEEAFRFFNIPEGNKVILVLGGSLGARTINESILEDVEKIASRQDVTLLWQTGKLYYEGVKDSMKNIKAENVKVFDFIHRMDLAYASANIIISRAGAGTISELCLVGKACILVPSPNVAEDHQTKNAKALAEQNAAILITDKDSPSKLVNTTINLLSNKVLIEQMELNIKKMALPNSAQIIAKKVIELAQDNKK